MKFPVKVNKMNLIHEYSIYKATLWPPSGPKEISKQSQQECHITHYKYVENSCLIDPH